MFTGTSDLLADTSPGDRMPARSRSTIDTSSASASGSVQFHREHGSGGSFADRPGAADGGFAAGAAAVGVRDVQLKPDPPKKKVTGRAGARLGFAKDAIKHTKEVMKFGAGNQAEALRDSNFNAYFRMKVMRDMSCWEMAPSVRAIAMSDRDALTAAMADLAHGGNCGEHAMVAFDYLNTVAKGEVLNRADVEGLDHAFVIMGDIGKEGDADLVLSDPWPTAATACTWEDHFAYTPDRAKINKRRTVTATGSNNKAVIARGLKLSARGEKMIEMAYTAQETHEKIDKDLGGWIWDHQDAAARDYTYVTDEDERSGQDDDGATPVDPGDS